MTPHPPAETARALREGLDRLSLALLRRRGPVGGPGIAGGEAGLALTHAALDGVFPARGHLDVATRRLERALTTCGRDASSLIEGSAGVAWAARRLAPGQVDLALAGFDRSLGVRLRRRVRPVNADLFHGLAGLLCYAVDRPAPDEDGLIERLLDRLESSAVLTAEGACWRSTLALAGDVGARQLGMAHGSAGVLSALTALESRGVAAARARALAEPVAAWMLAQRQRADGRARLPDAVLDDGSPRLVRAAYCRGDLGAALALVRAGMVFGRADWRDAGCEVARGVAAVAVVDAEIRDTCVCHGAAGQVLCFHRLAELTGEACFVDARDRWLAALGAMRGRRGVGGYTFWNGAAWVSDATLLDGAAGVALVAAAVMGHEERGWDAPLGTHALLPASREPDVRGVRSAPRVHG